MCWQVLTGARLHACQHPSLPTTFRTCLFHIRSSQLSTTYLVSLASHLLIVSQELEAVRHHPLLARHFPEVLPLVAEAMQPYGDVSQYGAVAQVGMYIVVVVVVVLGGGGVAQVGMYVAVVVVVGCAFVSLGMGQWLTWECKWWGGLCVCFL